LRKKSLSRIPTDGLELVFVQLRRQPRPDRHHGQNIQQATNQSFLTSMAFSGHACARTDDQCLGLVQLLPKFGLISPIIRYAIYIYIAAATQRTITHNFWHANPNTIRFNRYLVQVSGTHKVNHHVALTR
jgi:hypothetical protein